VRIAIAMPRRLRMGGATASCTATSQRLMNSDATDSTFGSRPSAMRRSMPRM
jgi:hypothetical protein